MIVKNGIHKKLIIPNFDHKKKFYEEIEWSNISIIVKIKKKKKRGGND